MRLYASSAAPANWSRTLSSLFTSPGQGQAFNAARLDLHARGATRPWSDPMMWSHLPFVGASWAAFTHGVLELFALSSVTLVLSLLYHRTYERPGRLCATESIVAKVLFVYGAAQLLSAPSATLLYAELSLLALTVATFISTNLQKHLYDRFHIGMHLFPALWCALVGVYHAPLIL